MAGNLSKYTVNNASETLKRIRHRQFTEAELYRPMSQLFDATIDYCTRKRMRTWGITLLANGATHFITSMITDFPDRGHLSGNAIGMYYALLATAIIVAGIVLTVLSYVLAKNPDDKEKLLQKYIDKEFTDDPDLAQGQFKITNDFIDGAEFTQNCRFGKDQPNQNKDQQ